MHRNQLAGGDEPDRRGCYCGMTHADDDRLAVIRAMSTEDCERITLDSL
jgi:hypothetical protein